MLLSLAACSQRMAQTRLIDSKQLGELARVYSVNTLENLLFARTQTTPGAVPGMGGSTNNLVALMQANSLSVASGQRAALAAVARGYAVAGLAARGPGARVGEDVEEEDEPDPEYGSGSDDDDEDGTET